MPSPGIFLMSCSPGISIPRFVYGAMLSLLCSTLPAAPVDTVSPVRPLEAELIAPLDLSRVHIGSQVLVRVALEWADSNCMLRAGSIVQGQVVEFTKRSKGAKNSQVQLVFGAADCEAHHESAFPFTLMALIGPADGSLTGQSGVSEAPPLADAVGNAIGGAGGIRNAHSASAISSGFNLPARSLPTRILPGQVIDLRRTTLSVGTGVDGATVITALGHDLRLERGTSLILVHSPARGSTGSGTNLPADRAVKSSPEHKGFGMFGTGGGGSELVSSGGSSAEGTAELARPMAPVLVPEAPDETDICSGVCNVVGGTGDAAQLPNSAAVASLVLGKFGYSPRNNRELLSFDDEATLTYLDANDLLCTFDPHHLRERAVTGGEAVRTIRAVLIDPQTHAVKRVMEWRVRGEGQYLWRLADGRVLVSMGHALTIFDGQLKPLRSIPVAGRMAWVAASPSSDTIAVGTVRERYSAGVYRDLEAILPDTPEEDIDVRVFNKEFAMILTSQQSSKSPVPVLSDSGELRVRGQGHTRWTISEYRWNRTEHTIASTKSTCRPTLSTPEHDLIFAVGCTASGGRWYRILRADGHPLLKGESPSDEVQQTAEGVARGAFAVRIVKTIRPMNYGQPFRKIDLVQERIAVYSSSDGANLAAVSTADFALSKMGFALSPSGDQMALMGSSSILFFAVNLNRN